MIRFATINKSTYDDSSESESEIEKSDRDDIVYSKGSGGKFDGMSIEAQESHNMRLYENALRSQQNNDYLQAQQLYQELLQTPLIAKIKPTSKKSVLSSTMAMLKYSTLKNMANICENIDNKELALKLSTEAVDLDGRDVSLWYNIGKLSMDLEKWNISRLALEKAIQISPTHWLSLERIIELLYVIGDDDSCISIIDQKITPNQPFHFKSLIIKALIQRNDASMYSEINQFLNHIKNNSTSVNYIQSLIKKREKIQNKLLVQTLNNNNINLNDKLIKELEKSKEYTLNTPTWNSLLDLLNLIYNEKKELSTLSIFSPIEIKLSLQEEQKLKQNLDQNPQQILDSSNNNNNNINSNNSNNNNDIDKIIDNSNSNDTGDEINKANIEIIDLVEAENKEKEKEKEKEKDKELEQITTPPTSTTTMTSLTNSSGTIPTRSSTPTPQTQTTTITSRRMERAKAGSKQEENKSENEEYIEKFININRPISATVLNQLSTDELFENNININEEKKKEKQPSTATTTIANNQLKSNENEKSTIYKFINQMNEFSIKEPSLMVSVIDWMIEALNFISREATSYNLPVLINSKINKTKSIIDSHLVNGKNDYQDYYLLLAELTFDKHQSFLLEKKKKLQKLKSTQQQQQKSNESSQISPNSSNNNVPTTSTSGSTATSTSITQQLKENQDSYIPNQELSNLSYYLQILSLKKFIKPLKLVKDQQENEDDVSMTEEKDKEEIEKELIFELRYQWLLSNYSIEVMGDVNMAILHFKECEGIFEDYNKRGFKSGPLEFLSISHCKFDRVVSPLIISDKISNIQDQQEKNAAGQLFTSNKFDSVISLLEPLFPDSLCALEFQPITAISTSISTATSTNLTLFEFKNKDYLNTDCKSRLNRIDLLLQSYLNVSNTRGVLKMIIILLREVSSFINQSEILSNYTTLIEKVFKHENMKSKILDENESTLLSILIRIIFRYYKKIGTYQYLELFLDIYQLDSTKKLKTHQMIPIYSMYHSDIGKKKQCLCLDSIKFLNNYSEILFKILISEGDITSEMIEMYGNDMKVEQIALKFISELCQCYYCLYGIKLMTSLEDHQNAKSTNRQQLKGPGIYMQLFIVMKILLNDEDDINIPLNPFISNQKVLNLICQYGNKKEFKDLTEKIYQRFPEPPSRVTKYKSIIDDYLSGTIKELTEESMIDVYTPPKFDYSILYDKNDSVNTDNPIFDDIFTDIYYMFALTQEKDQDNFRSLLVKDLYCNPIRIDSWLALSKSYSDDLLQVTSSDGILIRYPDSKTTITTAQVNQEDNTVNITEKDQNEDKEMEEDDQANTSSSSSSPSVIEIEEDLEVVINRLYKKLKIILKQITKIAPKEKQFKELAFLIYEKHYFIRKERYSEEDYNRKLQSIYKRSLFYLNQLLEVKKNEAIEAKKNEYQIEEESFFYQVFKAKLEKKLGEAPSVYLESLYKTIQILPTAVKGKTNQILPLYRLHAERLKLLLPLDKPVNEELLDLLEQYNFIPKSSTSTTATSTSVTSNKDQTNKNETNNESSPNDNEIESNEELNTKEAIVDTLNSDTPIKELSPITTSVEEQQLTNDKQQVEIIDLDKEESQQQKEQEEETTVLKEKPSLESRRDALIENSLAALVHCRSIVSYHHQASYRIVWTIRNNTRKENYSSNALQEFIRLFRPRLSRLTKTSVWSIWNDDLIGGGKLDRYSVKYYKFLTQLLEENNDIKNLEIIYFKIKNDPKFTLEASQCFISCCNILSNIISIKKDQQRLQSQQSQQPQQSTIDMDSIFKYEWEFYNDMLTLFPSHKEIIQNLIIESWSFANHNNHSPSKNQSFNDIISIFEKKFSRADKRKKKPSEETTLITNQNNNTNNNNNNNNNNYNNHNDNNNDSDHKTKRLKID